MCGPQTSNDPFTHTHTAQHVHGECSSKLLDIIHFRPTFDSDTRKMQSKTSLGGSRLRLRLDEPDAVMKLQEMGEIKSANKLKLFCTRVVCSESHSVVLRKPLSSNTVTYSTPRRSISAIFGSQ